MQRDDWFDRCLDEDAIASVAEGHADPAAIAHLADCAGCRRRVAALRRVLSAPEISREVALLDRRPGQLRRWALPAAFAAAAAIAAFVIVPRQLPDSPADAFRDGAPAVTGPAPVSPRDSLAGFPSELRWRAVAGAPEYRVIVFDEEGGVVWAAETADTVVSLGPQVPFAPGALYWWRVEARVDFDRWVPSPITPFVPGVRPAERNAR
jgi:hypothetical protein